MELKTRTYEAVRPSGEIVWIEEYQEFIGPNHVPGMKRLSCAGARVNRVDDHTFKIVRTGEIVTMP